MTRLRRSIPIRNPVARSPLLRKGGAHIKSKSGQRVRARLTTYETYDEWVGEELEEMTKRR
ncbi:MAG: hypothetical protein K0U40_09225 [Betaproteobacteria bacterium]|nr:hypothetical protein [Betaproteobacteria bacterium]